jgi:hypothetical protein
MNSNNNNSSSPQRQRREARRTKRCHQRISLVTLLALAVSPSFVALYYSSKNDHHHHHASSTIKTSLRRPPPPTALRDRLHTAASSRKTKTTRSSRQRTTTRHQQQQPPAHQQTQKELVKLKRIDSAPQNESEQPQKELENHKEQPQKELVELNKIDSAPQNHNAQPQKELVELKRIDSAPQNDNEQPQKDLVQIDSAPQNDDEQPQKELIELKRIDSAQQNDNAQPQKELVKLKRIDSAPHNDNEQPQKELVELKRIYSAPQNDNENDGIVCRTISKQQQQQQQGTHAGSSTVSSTDEEQIVICCARWEYNTDDWWLQHFDYEIQQENATHTCFGKITNPQHSAFLQRVERNQWHTSHHTKTEMELDDDYSEEDDEFCAHDVQVHQISTGYAAALTSLTRSFAAALAQNRPFQYNKRHDRYHWNFSIRHNSNSSAKTTANATEASGRTITTATTKATALLNAKLHWAYCPTQDMNCFYLPLGQCRPQLGRHDEGFRGKKPPSAGAAAAARAAAISNNNNTVDTTTAATTIQQERLEFLWLRRYAFRPRHALRHQLYLFLQEHLTPTHQQQLARIQAASQKLHQQSTASAADSSMFSCTAIHIRRGDVAFGKGRRYAAVQEYLDAGNISQGETIVLLTDDASTIDEVQEFHNAGNHTNDHSHDNHESSTHYYNWIYVQRPRFLGSQGGFEGFVPSNDPAFEVVAILADMHLASYCPRLVHGKSGFVDLLVEERERAGLPLQTILLDIQQDKGSQPKLDAQARAQQYLQRIRQAHHDGAVVVSEQ